MEFAFLVPAPDPIPIPWMWLQGLLLATFVLHLLFMNAMLGTGIIALVAMFRRRTNGLPVAKAISTKLPTLIAFTVNTGVAPLLFIHVLYGQFIFTSSILMAIWWLSAVGILLIAYYAAYLFDFKFEALSTARILPIATATVLLLVVGFLFSNNMTLMLSPDRWIRYLDSPGGSLLNLAEPMLIPRYLHFVTASVAVGGLVLAWIWQLKERKGLADAEKKSRQAMGWFTGATRFYRGIHHEIGLECSNCHGTMADVAASLLMADSERGKPSAGRIMKWLTASPKTDAKEIAGRRPWVNLPKCLNCHVDFQPPDTDEAHLNNWSNSEAALFRSKTDDAGILCISCHGSPHALYPATNSYGLDRDNIPAFQFQGSPYPIGSDGGCRICHTAVTEETIHHFDASAAFRNTQ